MALPENEAPASSLFCPERDASATPVVRLFGGVDVVPTIDPSKIPLDCTFSLDLIGKMTSVLAPLAPVLDVLDLVATLVQAFLVLIEAVQNPLKITKLLTLLPGLVEKLNKLLAKLPVLPTGILAFVRMVVDVLALARVALACASQTIDSIRREIEAIDDRVAEAIAMDDDELRANALEILECARREAVKRASVVARSLAPVSKMLCSIKAILTMIPGGVAIAERPELSVPDVSALVGATGVLSGLAAASSALTAAAGGIATIEELVAALVAGITLDFGKLDFTCVAPVTITDDATAEPVLDALLAHDSSLAIPLPSPFATAPSVVDVPIVLVGSGFAPETKVYFGTEEVPTENLAIAPTRIVATIPAEMLSTAGTFKVSVVNTTAGSARPFQTATYEGAAERTKVSQQLDADVG